MPYKRPNYYTIYFSAGSATLADSTTYYIGSNPVAFGTGHTPATGCVNYAMRSGRIIALHTCFSFGNIPTNETVEMYVRKNDTTDYAVSTTSNLGAAYSYISNNNLNIPIKAGDYLQLKLVIPAMVTNPTTSRMDGLAYVLV